MKRLRLFCLGLFLAVYSGSLQVTANASSPRLPAIGANDNRIPAGQLVAGTLHLSLSATWGRWYPDGSGGKPVPIEAFAETGKAPQIPGPLIRVPLGTVALISIHNAIPGSRLTVHGLLDRPALRDEPFTISFGQTRTVRIRAGAVGTFAYWASTTGNSITQRFGADSQLGGAMVVDPKMSRAPLPLDRIFVITEWDNVHDAAGNPNFDYLLTAINGRSWPYTERLAYPQGALVHWRVVNPAFEAHPLHLHGFYFAVNSRGDGITDVGYPSSETDRRVTELVEPGHTFSLTWQATRAGNWLFHCHLTYHTFEHLPIAQMLNPKPLINDETYENHFLRHAAMGGLILAFTVRGEHASAAEPLPVAHRIGLLVEPASDNKPSEPSFKYVLKENGTAVSEPGAVGPPIILMRGALTAIDITNRLDEPTSIHWHGIELSDSYYDGVAGYSGEGMHLAQMIDPGRTFEARLIPPRAGTFIYHTHMDDVYQLRGGLAGPLIVLNHGESFDASKDHIFMITTTHRLEDTLRIFVNGSFQPSALTVRAGVPQRLRFINMTTFWTNVVVSLDADNRTLQWRPLARDGADLQPARRTLEPACETITIGGTADFVFTPSAGEALLQIWPAIGYPPVNVPIHAS